MSALSNGFPDRSMLQEIKRRDWEAAQRAYFTGDSSLAKMFAEFVRGIGIYDDFTLHAIRSQLNVAAADSGLLEEAGSVVDSCGRLKTEYLELVCGEFRGCYDPSAPAGAIQNDVLLAESLNDQRDLVLPPGINMVAKVPVRPEVFAHSTTGFELFLHPFCYQLSWRHEHWFCRSASNRSLSRPALEIQTQNAEVIDILGDVVIVQDRFPGSNFSHFLFDWVTRIGLICESGLVDPRNCCFAMGGMPGPFERKILELVADEFDLSHKQFLFPSRGIVLRSTGRAFWFSDQVTQYLHPAQIAHPKSISILRRIAARIAPRSAGRFSRIYLSRIDAGRRRVTNEAEIIDALGNLGYEPIVLSDFAVEQQLALVAGAEQIIAPHGMGLTHVGLHPGTPSLIELHNPVKGTDCYALMAKSMGCPYAYVEGEPNEGHLDDFAVPLEALMSTVERLVTVDRRVSPSPPPGRILHDQTSARSTESRRTSKSGEPMNCPEAPFGWTSRVLLHVRADSVTVPDSNVGVWTDIPVEPGRFYTGSCLIWIPLQFRGTKVELNVGEWPGQWRSTADLALRDQWQVVAAGKTAPPGVELCNLVLRVDAPTDDFVFSTNWSIRIGVGTPVESLQRWMPVDARNA